MSEELDTTKIGQIAAEFMGILEVDAENALVENLRIVNVGIVAEVIYELDGEEVNAVSTACTDKSRVYQTGLFTWAVDLVEGPDGEPVDDEEEEEDDGIG